MSSATAVKFEYRCTQCYQTLYAAVEEAETQTTCRYCGQELSIPAATPDRVARAEHIADDVLETQPPQQVPPQQVAPPQNPVQPDLAPQPTLPPELANKNLSDAELEQLVKQQLHCAPSEMQSLSSIAASRLKRFAGAFVDGFLMVIAFGFGGALLMILTAVGWIEVEMLREATTYSLTAMSAIFVFYFPPLALAIFQWNMIAVDGQTIGKKLLQMKIVTHDGRNPGFFQGVVIRNWVRALLCTIPFFGLIDIVVIFGESKRCVHDFIANTHVVDV